MVAKETRDSVSNLGVTLVSLFTRCIVFYNSFASGFFEFRTTQGKIQPRAI